MVKLKSAGGEAAFEVAGFRRRVSGVGYRVSGVGYWISGAGPWGFGVIFERFGGGLVW
jgi:hypothetical protein